MFRKNPSLLPTSPVEYPSGTAVSAPSGMFLIKAGKRYRIVSERVLKSWNFPRVVTTSDIAISKYRIAGKLGFREGTLIHNIKDGKLYIMENNLKRHIESPDVIERLGAVLSDAILVSNEELKLHKDGDPWL